MMANVNVNTLVPILEQTVSAAQNELRNAQQVLEQFASTDFPGYVRSLSDVLANSSISSGPVARMAAGLQLKNLLTSKDATVRDQFQQRWLTLPEDTRSYVKLNVLRALGTESGGPSSASQCVAYIAVTELPHNLWDDVIDCLADNVTVRGASLPHNGEFIKEASLEAIGYICADIDQPEVLMTKCHRILTAIMHGMRKEEPSNRVRFTATNALLNSLDFYKSTFDNQTERNYIMQVVCEATQAADPKVKVAALQCVAEIMVLYYQHMERYMKDALFRITTDAMRSDVDEVALQGMEFWCNVCDEEMELALELSEAIELGRPLTRTSRFYAKGGLPYLIPLLLETLTKQELGDDEDWNPCEAAGVCLSLFANCCKHEVIPHVLPFVQANINHEDWRRKNAAVTSIGSILEGPNPNAMKELAFGILPTLISLMSDGNVVVRGSTAFAIRKICEVVPDSALTPTSLPPLLAALINALQGEPRVAVSTCWALASLAEAAYDSAWAQRGNVHAGGELETYLLTPFFRPIVDKLLATTDRGDGGEANLRGGAYETLMKMIKNSPRDCYETVQETALVILERLRTVLLAMDASTTDRTLCNDLQSSLCATLESVLRKVTREDASKISDLLMNVLLQLLNSSGGPTGRSGGVQEDALQTVGALAQVMGENFLPYMESFRPILITSLQNVAETAVCSVAVGVSQDICSALGHKVQPFCDEIMTCLLQNLGNANVERSLKPSILKVFEDVALALGSDFVKYLDPVLQTLMQAGQAQVDRNDFEMVEYLCDLREGVLEAYTGIIQGLRGDASTPRDPTESMLLTPELQLMEPHVPYIVQLISKVARDEDKSDSNIAAAAGLIGDLLIGYGDKILPLLNTETVNELLTSGQRSRTSKTKELATWATQQMRKVRNQNTSETPSC